MTTSDQTGNKQPSTAPAQTAGGSGNPKPPSVPASGGLLRSDGRVSFWPGFRLTSLSLFVLLGWGVVFFNGVTLNSLPFRQVVNIASVNVPGQVSAQTATTPNGQPGNGANSPDASREGAKTGDAADNGDAKPKPATLLTNEAFASLVIPDAPSDATNPGAVNLDRMKHYFGLVKIDSNFMIMVWSWVLGFMSYPYTNLLLLTWLSATLGSLVNYTVIALRRSESSDSKRGAGRMLHSLTGSLVVGVGLGFTMYVAIVGGATVITKTGLSITTPDDYANKASIISLLTLLAALFPVWFLNVLETRLQQAERSSGQRPETPLASAVVEVKLGSKGSPASAESFKLELKGSQEFVASRSAEIAAQFRAKLDG